MNEFEKALKAHLDKVAEQDPQFAEKYAAGLAGKKDIKSCGDYIILQVEQSRRKGFTDDEVYGMAVHYYDEEGITAPARAPKCQVVVNHEIQLSAEEVKQIQREAREKAEAKVRKEEEARIEKQKEQPIDAKSERVIRAARRVLNNWRDGSDYPDVSGDFVELEYAIQEYDQRSSV